MRLWWLVIPIFEIISKLGIDKMKKPAMTPSYSKKRVLHFMEDVARW